MPSRPHSARQAWAVLRSRAWAKNATASIQDAIDTARGRRDPSLPPRRLMIAVGSVSIEDFKHEGLAMKEHLIEVGGLRPEYDVLDVGCGTGRIALPLTEYLTGSYSGFDIVPAWIRWCQENITPRFEHFRFERADVRSRHYNPRGRFEAHEYRFPYEDASFDFVFQTSVLTHLLPEAAENYLRETVRVLRPGGTCFATYLLLDDERREQADRGELPFTFRVRTPAYWAVKPQDPEAIVAYPAADVLDLFERVGLRDSTVHQGTWAGRRDGLTWQDTVVARRS